MNIKLRSFLVRAAWVGSALAAIPGCMLLVGTDDYTTDAGASGPRSDGASIPTGADAGRSGSSGSSSIGDSAAGSSVPGDAPSSEGSAQVEAGTGACAPGINDLGCSACWKTTCCTAYATCLADPACAALVTCVQGCSAPPCSCTASFASTGLFIDLVNCTLSASQPGTDAGSECSFCPILGVGDPCVNSNQCIGANNFCVSDPACTAPDPINCAQWCAPSAATGCAANADCYGAFSGTTNGNGFTNSCVAYDNLGDMNCFPGCDPATDGGCAGSYGGGACTSTVDVDGGTVTICQ